MMAAVHIARVSAAREERLDAGEWDMVVASAASHGSGPQK
jgi:hypothetical protein